MRWSSTFLLLQHFNELRDTLAIVLHKLEWDDLAASEWKILSIIQSLLQQIAVFATLISGEEFNTISSIIPTIMELYLHLENVTCKFK